MYTCEPQQNLGRGLRACITSLHSSKKGQVQVLIVLQDSHLGVCQIPKQNIAGPGVGPYSPERQSPRSLLGL